MSRRVTELRQAIARAAERQRYAERQLALFTANNPQNDEISARTRRKLETDIERARNDAEILQRALSKG